MADRAGSTEDSSSGHVRAAILLLVTALILGGAGVAYPLLEMMIELAALALLTILWLSGRLVIHRADRALPLMVVLLVAVPIIQLVPLPPSWWRALPGHELAAQASDAAGQQALWRPLSLTPAATVRALLGLLPPVAMLAATIAMPGPERRRLCWAVVAVGLLSALLGAMQFASGGDFTPLETAHQGWPVGLFVNRNHQAALLLCCMPIAGAVLIGRAPPWHRGAWAAALLVLALAVIATGSRMGIILLPLSVVLPLAAALRRIAPKPRTAAILAILLGVAVALTSFVGRRALARFNTFGDDRLLFWRTMRPAIAAAWPTGTGLGGFVPVYQSVEPLQQVRALTVNHAHDDYLELLLEAGLPALLLIAAFVVFLAITVLRRRADRPGQAGPALGMIVVLLACSLVDYPLRMTALATLFAIAVGLLTHALVDARAAPPARPARLAILAPVAGVGWLIVANGMALHALSVGNDELAMRVAPWMDDPPARAAAARFAIGDEDAAVTLARRALARAPLDPIALRVLTIATDADPAVLAKLGWRDLPAQAWLADLAFNAGDPEVGMERLDALLRQGGSVSLLLGESARRRGDPVFAAALARRLATRPPWEATLQGKVLAPPRN